MPPSKLKTGFGEGVCTVLLQLCQISLQNRFKYKKHMLHMSRDDAGGFGEDDADDVGDDFEGNADVADMARDDIKDDEDIDEEMDYGGVGAPKQNQDQDEGLMQ